MVLGPPPGAHGDSHHRFFSGQRLDGSSAHCDRHASGSLGICICICICLSLSVCLSVCLSNWGGLAGETFERVDAPHFSRHRDMENSLPDLETMAGLD